MAGDVTSDAEFDDPDVTDWCTLQDYARYSKQSETQLRATWNTYVA